MGQEANDTATAGVIARPPLLFLGALSLGLALDRLIPQPFAVPGADFAHWVAGAAMFVVGLGLAAGSIRNFFRAATPVPTYKATRLLVTTGIYHWSRNPIYLGMFLMYGGIGIAAASPWMLLLMVPVVLVIRHGVVAREEAYLERRFGPAYRDYKARVRRWL